MSTIEKIEEIVEIHQLQFSFQTVVVQLSRNDEWRGFHPDPVHRQNGNTCAEDKCIRFSCARRLEFLMVQKTSSHLKVLIESHARQLCRDAKYQPSSWSRNESSKMLQEFKLVLAKEAKQSTQFKRGF